MAIIPRIGRASMAAAVKAQPLHIAIGLGDPLWDTDGHPRAAEDPAATALLAEVGRRTITASAYVVSDSAGEIELPGGRYTVVDHPTALLYVRAAFDFADASAAVIREAGLFVGTTAKDGVPAGQRYFQPGDIADPGTLLLLDHIAPVVRTQATRETYEFVVSF